MGRPVLNSQPLTPRTRMIEGEWETVEGADNLSGDQATSRLESGRIARRHSHTQLMMRVEKRMVYLPRKPYVRILVESERQE